MTEFIKNLNDITVEKLALLLSFAMCIVIIFRFTLRKWVPVLLFKFFKIGNGNKAHDEAIKQKQTLDASKAQYIDAVERVIFEIPISRKTVLEFNQNVVVNNQNHFLKQLNIIADYHRRTGMAMTYGLVDIKDSNKLFEHVFLEHIKKQIDENNILIKIIFPNNLKFERLQNNIDLYLKRTGKESVKIVVDGYRRSGEISPVEMNALRQGYE